MEINHEVIATRSTTTTTAATTLSQHKTINHCDDNNDNDDNHPTNTSNDNAKNNNDTIVINSVACTAPGKAIVFGEHAVVYGYKAIAVALSDLRIRVDIYPTSKHQYIDMSLPDLVSNIHKNTGQKQETSSKQQEQRILDTVRIPIQSVQQIRSQLNQPPTNVCSKLLEDLVRSEAKLINLNIICSNDTDTVNESAFISNSNINDSKNEVLVQTTISFLYLLSIILDDDTFKQQDSTDRRQQQQEATYGDVSNTCNTTSFVTGLHVIVQSKDLPVGAGLGSSAAFSVACAGAILQIRQQIDAKRIRYAYTTHADIDVQQQQQQQQQLTKTVLDKINQYSYYSEMLLHGQPSGIDNAVSTYGGAILFQRILQSSSESQSRTTTVSSSKASSQQPTGTEPAVTTTTTTTTNTDASKTSSLPSVDMKHLSLSSSNSVLRLLLVNTNVPRSTKVQVSNVRTLYDNNTSIIKPILQSMGNIAQSLYDYLSIPIDSTNVSETTSSQPASNTIDNTDATITCQQHPILNWITINQCLLRTIQVSHPSIENICTIVENNTPVNTTAVKLTGAGGGGCVLVLVNPLLSIQQQQTIQQSIQTALKMNNTNTDQNDNENTTTTTKNTQVPSIPPSSNSTTTQWSYTCFQSTFGGDGVLFVPSLSR
jgi:mevalonate kinase